MRSPAASLLRSHHADPPLGPPQDYTVDPVVFHYRDATVVSYINPDAGPTTGGSLVVVRGSHFAGGDGYRCRFGTHVTIASFADDETVRCTSPTARAVHVSWKEAIQTPQRGC